VHPVSSFGSTVWAPIVCDWVMDMIPHFSTMGLQFTITNSPLLVLFWGVYSLLELIFYHFVQVNYDPSCLILCDRLKANRSLNNCHALSGWIWHVSSCFRCHWPYEVGMQDLNTRESRSDRASYVFHPSCPRCSFCYAGKVSVRDFHALDNSWNWLVSLAWCRTNVQSPVPGV